MFGRLAGHMKVRSPKDSKPTSGNSELDFRLGRYHDP